MSGSYHLTPEDDSSTVINEFQRLHSPKVDYSSICGKKVLVSPTEVQFELLKKRLEERTEDCRGETIYEIGIGEGKILNMMICDLSLVAVLYCRYHYTDGSDNGLDADE